MERTRENERPSGAYPGDWPAVASPPRNHAAGADPAGLAATGSRTQGRGREGAGKEQVMAGFTDALRRDGGITREHVRHEEAAGFAAAAEAALTGELAVCAGSCGPGNLHQLGAARPRAVAPAAKVHGAACRLHRGEPAQDPHCQDRQAGAARARLIPAGGTTDVTPPRLGWLPRRSRRPLWPASRSAAEPPHPRQRTPVDRRGGARVPARGPGASSGAVLEWPARRPDIGVGPPTAVGAAAKRSDPPGRDVQRRIQRRRGHT